MFELHIPDTDITSGTIPITWCLTKDTLDKLSKDNISNPQVVVVIAPDGPSYHVSKETRFVFPLKDLMGFINFKVSGKNKIWAFIADYKRYYCPKDYYLTKGNGIFITTVLNETNDGWSHVFDGANQSNGFSNEPRYPAPVIEVDVPKECFAPEPPQWEKAWVNFFFKNKAFDQCDYRKRRILAYTFQPLWMIVNLLFRSVVTLLFLLCGVRNFTLDFVIHPLSTSVHDMFDMFDDGIIFIRKNYEYTGEHLISFGVKKLCLFPLIPFISAPVVLMAWYHQFAPIIAIMFVITIVIVIFSTAEFFIDLKEGKFDNIFSKIKNLIASKHNSNWYLDDKETQSLLCSDEKKSFKVKDLPAKNRTLKLHFLDLKSKVCRPFSG